MIALKGKYHIYDLNENKCLEVNTNGILFVLDRFLRGILSVGYKLYLSNLEGDKRFILKKKCGFIKGEFIIEHKGVLVAEINQDIKSFKPKIYIYNKNIKYIINGDIMGRGFAIYKEEKCVAKINKFRRGFKDKYKLHIFEEDNDYLFIFTVIVVDILIR